MENNTFLENLDLYEVEHMDYSNYEARCKNRKKKTLTIDNLTVYVDEELDVWLYGYSVDSMPLPEKKLYIFELLDDSLLDLPKFFKRITVNEETYKKLINLVKGETNND